MSEPRENDRTRTTYVVEARCDDCGVSESWTIDDIEQDDLDDLQIGQLVVDHHDARLRVQGVLALRHARSCSRCGVGGAWLGHGSAAELLGALVGALHAALDVRAPHSGDSRRVGRRERFRTVAVYQ